LNTIKILNEKLKIDKMVKIDEWIKQTL
jgi:hypothetical protein